MLNQKNRIRWQVKIQEQFVEAIVPEAAVLLIILREIAFPFSLLDLYDQCWLMLCGGGKIHMSHGWREFSLNVFSSARI
jgi:hypothetical protein